MTIFLIIYAIIGVAYAIFGACMHAISETMDKLYNPVAQVCTAASMILGCIVFWPIQLVGLICELISLYS